MYTAYKVADRHEAGGRATTSPIAVVADAIARRPCTGIMDARRCCTDYAHVKGGPPMSTREIKQPTAEHPITITPTSGRVQVRVNGELVADTRAALGLAESTYADSPVHPDRRRRPRGADPHRHPHVLPVQGGGRLLQRHRRGHDGRRRDLDLRASRIRRSPPSPGTSRSTRPKPTSASTRTDLGARRAHAELPRSGQPGADAGAAAPRAGRPVLPARRASGRSGGPACRPVVRSPPGSPARPPTP